MSEVEGLLERHNERKDKEKKVRIMVVDDDPSIGRSLFKVFMEYEVIIAQNGPDSLEKINPDIFCVIMDAKMPGMDGFTASKKIWEKFPNIPIIMHTAFHGEHRTSDVVSYHFFGYVEKGSDLENLKFQVRNACENYANKLKLEEYQRDLERKVEERTVELRNTNEALNKAYQDLQEVKEKEQYLDQQLRIRDVLQTSEDVGAQILHENKNLLQPLGNLINRTSRLISHTKRLLSNINEHQELRNNVDKNEIENLEFLLDVAEKGNQAADASYRLIMSSYEDFRQAYNPREEGRNDLNRDLGAVVNLIIDRNYRSLIKVTKEFNPVRVPQEYDSSRFNKGVFWNIIKNAREAIIEEKTKHAAGYEGKILVRTESIGDKTVVSIYDNGIGVQDGYEEKMFEKKETTKLSGTGLGLYTARLILSENNCGKIYYQKSDLPEYKTKMLVEFVLK